MLRGPIAPRVLLFALPLALSSIVQQLIYSTNIAVVGHWGSSADMAAVGSNSPVVNLIINLFVGLSLGSGVVVANLIGQRDHEGLRRAVHTTAGVALAAGGLLTIVGVALARPILTAMGTPPEVMEAARGYLVVFFAGAPFLMVYNFGSAVLRSLGDSKRPLLCLLAGGVINIPLNIFFVASLHLGASGVALATNFANAVAAVLVTRYLCREPAPYTLHLRAIAINARQLLKIVQIGIPAGLQGVVFSLSNIVIQSAINGHGPDAMAGSTISHVFEQLCYFVMSAFCAACVTFVAQNYGAHQLERCRRVFWVCLGLGSGVSLLLNVSLVCLREPIAALFTAEVAVAGFAYTRMQCGLAWQFLACSYEMPGAAMRGMGNSLLPAIIAIFGTCVLRVAYVLFVVGDEGSFARLIAVYPLSWCVTGALTLTAYFLFLRRVRGRLHA